MKITACIAYLVDSFCEEVYAVAFFKVVQLQTIGKVGNLIIHKLCVCGQMTSVCKRRILKIGQHLRKLCSNEKGPVF